MAPVAAHRWCSFPPPTHPQKNRLMAARKTTLLVACRRSTEHSPNFSPTRIPVRARPRHTRRCGGAGLCLAVIVKQIPGKDAAVL